MVVQAAQGLLDALRNTTASPARYSRPCGVRRDGGLLKLAASSRRRRSARWAQAAGPDLPRRELIAAPSASGPSSRPWTTCVTLWKYSHELMCASTLNAAALRAAERWPKARRLPALRDDRRRHRQDAGARARPRRAARLRRAALHALVQRGPARAATAGGNAAAPAWRAGAGTPSLRPLSAAVALACLSGQRAEPSKAVSARSSRRADREAGRRFPRSHARLAAAGADARAEQETRSACGADQVRLLPPVCSPAGPERLALRQALLAWRRRSQQARAWRPDIIHVTRCLLQRRVEGLGRWRAGGGLSPRPFALRCLLQLAFDEQTGLSLVRTAAQAIGQR